MGMSLQEALEKVDLESGKTYVVQVKHHWIQLKVWELPPVSPVVITEDDIMLDPWTVLPVPTGGTLIKAKPGTMPLPPPQNITLDDLKPE